MKRNLDHTPAGPFVMQPCSGAGAARAPSWRRRRYEHSRDPWTTYDSLDPPSLARQVRLVYCGSDFSAARPWRPGNQPRGGSCRTRLADHLRLQHVSVSYAVLAMQHFFRAHPSPSCFVRRFVDRHSGGLALASGTQVLAAVAWRRSVLRDPPARPAWRSARHFAQGRNWDISRDLGSKFFCPGDSDRAVQLRRGCQICRVTANDWHFEEPALADNLQCQLGSHPTDSWSRHAPSTCRSRSA